MPSDMSADVVLSSAQACGSSTAYHLARVGPTSTLLESSFPRDKIWRRYYSRRRPRAIAMAWDTTVAGLFAA